MPANNPCPSHTPFGIYLPIPLLHRHRLGEVARKVDIEAFHNGQPVRNQLQRDDVEDALQDVDRLGHLNLLGLARRKLLVTIVADDNGLPATGNDCTGRISVVKLVARG